MFKIDKDQRETLNKWIKLQDEKAAYVQDRDEPYYGSISGGYTYSFTPTGLGIIITVVNNITYEKIDLTDYKSW
jgi:hypothetical protein